MAKAIDKAYLLTQLKGYDEKVAGKKYALQSFVGVLPEGATATTVTAYIDEAVENGQYDDTQVKADIKANADAIAVLNDADTVDGSVAKTVKDAIDDFATKISDDGTINTFKELIDYAASHTAEFSELSGEVQANKTAIETLNGTGTTSVSGKISAAIGEVGEKTVKAYVDDAIEAAAPVFEDQNIDFDTEW